MNEFISPLHHIVLTVSNVAQSKIFYQTALFTLNWSIRNEAKDYVEFVPPGDPQGKNFLLVIGATRDRSTPLNLFNRNNIGLDHFSFQVQSKDELLKLATVLAAAGISMEDNGITDDDFGGTALFCDDPDGMKIEFHLHQ